MRFIKGKEELKEAEYYMGLAAKEAKKSTCKKSQRGAILVKGNKIIGKGHNKVTLKKVCNPCIREEIHDNSKVELCSAIHAEQMAIIDAANKGKTLKGTIMYHVKVKNGKIVPVGDLSCTVCSRIMSEAGIKFVLLQKNGYVLYEAKELNKLSFDYFLK